MSPRSTKLIDVNLEDARSRTFILFLQTADAIRKYADAAFYVNGLSTMKVMVLQILAFNGGTMTPTEISEWTLREPNGITTLIRRLERDGLVGTQRGTTDKRFLYVTLTDKGRKMLSQVAPAARQIVKQAMALLTDDQATALEESLRVLRQSAHDGLKQRAVRSHRRPE